MKLKRIIPSILLIFVIGLGLPIGMALAEEELPVCPNDVQGKVVAIKADIHQVIIEQEDGTQCSSPIIGGAIQPISALLSYYFGVSLQQIHDYHSDGIGYGVLVKLYALSNASGTPISDLITQLKSGTGMGKLFKTYGGKPAVVGVGQVQQKVKKTPHPMVTPPGLSNPNKPSNPGLSNAANHTHSHNPKFNPTPTPTLP
ncbi:MAG: hypothetical protein ACPL7A_00370 [Anaerolineales bacterium]